jgi:uncharacterized alpha-E superfamily protein
MRIRPKPNAVPARCKHFGRIEDIFSMGLHEYLVQFLGRVRDLGERVSRDFLVSAAD